MSSSSDLPALLALSKWRWAGPILADLSAHNGARFVEVRQRLGLARDSLSRTLNAAVDAGWVIPNPGYGHPLRPEYILTHKGERLAIRATAILEAQAAVTLAPNGLTRWSLPIIHSVSQGHRRFGEISNVLAPVGPRALSQSLKKLMASDLLNRKLIDDYPPTSLYDLTQQGKILAAAI